MPVDAATVRRIAHLARSASEVQRSGRTFNSCEKGLMLWAISDLSADDLQEFGKKFETALHAISGA